MKRPSINTTIEFIEDCRTYSGAGIYKVSFSDGCHYIGLSVNISQRMEQHLTDSFAGFPKSRSLRKMAKYKGLIRFEIIEKVADISTLRARELFHIHNYPGSDRRLNYVTGLPKRKALRQAKRIVNIEGVDFPIY